MARLPFRPSSLTCGRGGRDRSRAADAPTRRAASGRPARTVTVIAGAPLAGQAPTDPDEAEVAVHRPLLAVDAGAQQLARPLLGAPLAAGVAQLAPLDTPRPPPARPPRRPALGRAE